MVLEWLGYDYFHILGIFQLFYFIVVIRMTYVYFRFLNFFLCIFLHFYILFHRWCRDDSLVNNFVFFLHISILFYFIVYIGKTHLCIISFIRHIFKLFYLIVGVEMTRLWIFSYFRYISIIVFHRLYGITRMCIFSFFLDIYMCYFMSSMV